MSTRGMFIRRTMLAMLFCCISIPNAAWSSQEHSLSANCLIDLHLHLDGSLSLANARALAQMQGIELPPDDQELKTMLTVPEDCQDLNEYLERFALPLSLLQTPEAITQSVKTLLKELKDEGHIYAEIRFAPQYHTDKSLTQREVVGYAVEGLKGSGIPAGLILCCMRGDNTREANLETVEVAREYLSNGVVAIDLAGAEALYPTSDYKYVFDSAKEAGIPYTIHAGEASGPDSVREALSFGASRIGHGVRAAEDMELVAELANRGIPLEMCPTSNLNTRIFSSIKEYPLPLFLKAGVPVTINSDNRTVSNTTVRDEFDKLIEAFSLEETTVKKLLLNSANAAFAPDSLKEQLRQKIEAAFAD